jgi:hypothetical protein
VGPALTTAAWPNRPALASVWLAAAVGFGALLAVGRAAEGSLDDPDPVLQRPGFVDVGTLPQPAPPVGAIPTPGRRGVVFFERPDRLDSLCRALSRRPLPASVEVAIVVDGPGLSCPGHVVIPGQHGALAAGYGLRRPRDGGLPVGYAVVDSVGAIRYHTLDPAVAEQLDEVTTMLEAVR